MSRFAALKSPVQADEKAEEKPKREETCPEDLKISDVQVEVADRQVKSSKPLVANTNKNEWLSKGGLYD